MTITKPAFLVATALLALTASGRASGVLDELKTLAPVDAADAVPPVPVPAAAPAKSVAYDCRLTIVETVPVSQTPDPRGGPSKDFGNVPPPGAKVSCSGRGSTDPKTGKSAQRTVCWFRTEIDRRWFSIAAVCGADAPDCRPAGGLIYSGNIPSADRSSPAAYVETVVSAAADPSEGLRIGLTSAWDDTDDSNDGFRVGKDFVTLPLDAPRIAVKNVLRGRAIADVGLPVETELSCARR